VRTNKAALQCHHDIGIEAANTMEKRRYSVEKRDTMILRFEHYAHVESITCGENFARTIEDELWVSIGVIRSPAERAVLSVHCPALRNRVVKQPPARSIIRCKVSI